MNSMTPYVALFLSQLVSLGVIVFLLGRTEKFLTKSLVYMKSNSIHDVLAASHLLEDKPKDVLHDVGEVVDDLSEDEEVEARLLEVQKRHRKHLEPK